MPYMARLLLHALQGTVLIKSAAELEGYSKSEEDRIEEVIKGIAGGWAGPAPHLSLRAALQKFPSYELGVGVAPSTKHLLSPGHCAPGCSGQTAAPRWWLLAAALARWHCTSSRSTGSWPSRCRPSSTCAASAGPQVWRRSVVVLGRFCSTAT